MNNISQRNLKLMYSQTDIIEANPNMGITDIIETFDQIKEVARIYNSEKFDQVEISKLSEPYKEYFNYKENFLREDWNKIKDKYMRITEGDYYFLYRASYEITFYDDEDPYKKDIIPKGSPYWYWFREYFFRYCEKNDRWTPADICNKPFEWQYRDQIRNLIAMEDGWNHSYEDRVEKIKESDIDEKIIQLKKEYEEKKLAIKKSWEK